MAVAAIWGSSTCSTFLPPFGGDGLFNSSYSQECIVVAVVLICIFLMTDDVEHFFICILAICIFYSGDCLTSFAHFVVGVFVLLSCKNSLYIFWIFRSYIICIYCEYFLAVFSMPFDFHTVSFVKCFVFILIEFNLPGFFFPLWLVLSGSSPEYLSYLKIVKIFSLIIF